MQGALVKAQARVDAFDQRTGALTAAQDATARAATRLQGAVNRAMGNEKVASAIGRLGGFGVRLFGRPPSPGGAAGFPPVDTFDQFPPQPQPQPQQQAQQPQEQDALPPSFAGRSD